MFDFGIIIGGYTFFAMALGWAPLFAAEITDKGLAYLGAGIAMVGAAGAGTGQGIAAAHASAAVGRNPEAEAQIRSMMIVGAAIAESSALYCLVISILLIFVV